MSLKYHVMNRKLPTFSIFFLHALCIADASKAVKRNGVLLAESSSEKEAFCIAYFPDLSFLHHTESEADFHIIQEEYSSYFCTEKHGKDFDGKLAISNQDNCNLAEPVCTVEKGDVGAISGFHDQNLEKYSSNFCPKKYGKDFAGKVVISNLNNCSLGEQAYTVQEGGGVGAIFVFRGQSVKESLGNFSFSGRLKIAVAVLPEASAKNLNEMAKPVSVKLFSPIKPIIDCSLLLIWVVTMFTVCVGGYWSGHIRHKLHLKEAISSGRVNAKRRDGGNTVRQVINVRHAFPEASFLDLSPYEVVGIVLYQAAFLVVMYFFYDYLVKIWIILFVSLSMGSVYFCLHPLAIKIFPRGYILFECQLFGSTQTLDLRQLFVLAVSFSTPIAWIVTRRKMYASPCIFLIY